jgi:uncharacterized protein (DUF362 family)
MNKEMGRLNKERCRAAGCAGREHDRREFCAGIFRLGLGSAIALFAEGFVVPGGRRGVAWAASPADIAVVKGAPASATSRAIELLGGIGKYVRPGQRVVVKPNIGWDRAPEQAANTSPEVVVAVVRLCLEAGAGEVRVFDRSCNDPRLCFRRSGIQEAVEGIGDKRVSIFIPDERKYKEVAIPAGVALKSWLVYEDALAADVFINVPVAKHHGLTGLTMGLKNVMGVLGGNRGQIHTGFDDKIVDANLARPSHLTVLDATRILVAHGPQGGRVEDVQSPGVVVAGADIVAVDAYATRLFGKSPRDIGHLVRAAERGLGTLDLTKVGVREESV